LTAWLSVLYLAALAGISVFGLLGLVTLWLYRRHRQDAFPCPALPDGEWPPVTVQLPIHNERYVVERLVRAAAALDYPRERLQIQVIDDSTDDTTEIAAGLVTELQSQGLNIQLLHRRERSGFKAGALQAALGRATGRFLAVFDADFVPQPDFLRQAIPHFAQDERLGVVQARWGHLNATTSPLTGAQSIALDKHFVMEQTVRHRAGLFPKFNGSAGIWRRRCLVDAGGWEADTVCEDLCLSTRAVLRGWRFRFLNELVAPAELPTSIPAYKNQQARWAKGSTQCLIKYGPAILTDRQHRPLARAYALLSMAGYSTHFLLLILLLVQVPLIYSGYRPPVGVFAVAVLGVGQPLLFVLGQKEIYADWRSRLRFLPSLLIIAIGLAPANARAIAQAAFARNHTFVRTPKGLQTARLRSAAAQAAGYRLEADWIIWVELALALYAAFGLALCLVQGYPGPILFLATCVMGFGYVALASLRS
jgi:cellulose synthase/poly-beta-1,6-N-acetylglucosamine synthase-like glycosyltransferase